MYRYGSAAGPSETGVDWEAPGVQRPPRREELLAGRVANPDGHGRGTAGGKTNGGETARGGGRGVAQSGTPQDVAAYRGRAALRAGGDTYG
jgi:hypothetical protein